MREFAESVANLKIVFGKPHKDTSPLQIAVKLYRKIIVSHRVAYKNRMEVDCNWWRQIRVAELENPSSSIESRLEFTSNGLVI